MDLQTSENKTPALVCAACQVAGARIVATLVRRLFWSSIHSFDEEGLTAIGLTVKAARSAVQRAERFCRDVPQVSHVCGGLPPRCPTCGVPTVVPGVCLNLFCGQEMDGEQLLLLCPLKPQDAVAETDVAIRKARVPGEHDGGRSLWPNTLWVSLDGELFRTSPMFPTQLSEAEIMALPSKSREYVELADREIGITDGTALTGWDRNEERRRNMGIQWWSAYERPATSERFRVYGCDHE